MTDKPKVHLVRITPEDHAKIDEIAKSQMRSIPSELHFMINETYDKFKSKE